MTKLANLSVLEYARSHEAAFDFTAVNPLEYLDQSCELPSINLPLHQESQSSFDNYINSLHASVEENLRTEKFDVSKNDGRFLSTIIQRARVGSININTYWDSLLPPFNHLARLKLEPPLLQSNRKVNLPSIRRRSLFSIDSIKSPLVETANNTSSHGSFWDTVNAMEEGLKRERLECTKESFKLIQNARSCVPDTGRHIESILTSNKMLSPGHPSPTLLPLYFDDEMPKSPVNATKQMLPSPSSSHTSEIPQRRRGPDNTDIAPLKLIRNPSVKDRIWLLESSDIENMEPSSSQPEKPTPGIGCRQGTVDADQSAVAEGEFPHEKHQACEEENTTMRAADIDSVHNVTTVSGADPDPVQMALAAIAEGERQGSNGIYSPELGSRCHQLSKDLSPVHFEAACGSLDAEEEIIYGQEPVHPPVTELNYPMDEPPPNPAGHGSSSRHRSTSETATTDVAPHSIPRNSGDSIIDPHLEPQKSKQQREEVAIAGCSAKPKTTPDRQSAQPKKRKSKAEAGPRKRVKAVKEPDKQKTVVLMRETQKESSAPFPFTALGSLTSFMETRGITPKAKQLTKSPYFNNNKPSEVVDALMSANDTVEASPKQETPDNESIQDVGSACIHHIPQCPQASQEPPILILSTVLLKTHFRVVKFLETKDDAPTLIYRDYENCYGTQEAIQINPTQLTANHKQLTEVEADIIISPTTGIVLTTSQAITQVYLPGHRANPQVNGIAGINSPLRERIFRLAPRYEQVYVIICHSMGTRKRSSSPSPGSTADKRTITAMASLTAFCNSASAYSNITPLLISSAPDVVGKWVLSLANKHTLKIACVAGKAHQRNRFTPVNKPSLKTLLKVDRIENDSNWEVFLRQAGMNPFAAVVTLAILRKDEDEELANSDFSEYMEASDSGGKKVRSLSKFVEMGAEQRRALLGEVVGYRLLKRVGDMVDQDWQCDWALEFDGEL